MNQSNSCNCHQNQSVGRPGLRATRGLRALRESRAIPVVPVPRATEGNPALSAPRDFPVHPAQGDPEEIQDR